VDDVESDKPEATNLTDNPVDHLATVVAEAPGPMNSWCELTDKQSEVLNFIARWSDKWKAKVRASLQRWRGNKAAQETKLLAFRADLPAAVEATIGKIDPFILQEMVEASGAVDSNYVQDFLCGFPVTSVVGAGGAGTPIPGGQQTHGKPANGHVPCLEDLRRDCAKINQRTISRASARKPQSAEQEKLAKETWQKVEADIEKGRASQPMELDSFPSDRALLVDTFGLYECHGEATEHTVRVINNFKDNLVNSYAFMPEKLKYDSFPQLKEASTHLRARTDRPLRMGKADFKSAFKTLPPKADQEWLCFALVWNPHLKRLQVIQLFTQAFGSLGGVVAWYRTAKLLQTVMLELFDIVVFAYVDDFFWVMPDMPDVDQDAASYVLEVFKEVVTDLLGWDLDPKKEAIGSEIQLLGLQVRLDKECSLWKLNSQKAELWAKEFQAAIDSDSLSPSQASKFCGRLAFLNSNVFNRLGRALLRPLIWRQQCKYGTMRLTRRLVHSLRWYIAVLQRGICRQIPFARELPDTRVILYSDAEGSGHAAAVLIKGSTKIFMKGRIPNRLRHMLKVRKTNITGYELLIAVAAVVSFAPDLLHDALIEHYIDNQPAIPCIVKGFSKETDLSDIAGRLWFECGILMASYRAIYVRSKCNLSDGPSRDDVSLMEQLGFQEVPFRLPAFKRSLGSWMQWPSEPDRMVV